MPFPEKNMPFLTLAHAEDHTALEVHKRLTMRHGPTHCSLVLTNELLAAPHWCHKVGNNRVETEIRLADGRVLQSDRIDCVFNRVRYLYATHFMDRADQEYATMEWTALLLSWLHSLPCPVVNNVQPVSLGAQHRDRLVWLALAARAGLPVQGYRFATDSRRHARPDYTAYRRTTQFDHSGRPQLEQVQGPVLDKRPLHFYETPSAAAWRALVAGCEVYGPPEVRPYTKGLVKLGRLIDADLYAVDFHQFGPAWKVGDVTTFPHAETPSDLHAIVALLEQKWLNRQS